MGSTKELASSLTGSMTYFILTTIVFTVIKGFLIPIPWSEKCSSYNTPILLSYLLICLIIQIVINISNAKAVCEGTSQSFLKIFMYTLIPYFFIFSSIVILVSIRQGWLRPFSNTFGYLIAMILLGGGRSFNKLLESNKLSEIQDNPNKAAEIVDKIYSDESLTTNEIDKNNYQNFIKELLNINLTDIDGNPDLKNAYKHLFKMVVLKDIIAEMIWFLLAGCLAISIQSNIVNNVTCDYDPQKMKEIKERSKKEYDENNKKPTLYTVH